MGTRPLRVVLAASLLAACASVHRAGGRNYQLSTPAGWDKTTPLPLVVLLHGLSSPFQVQALLPPLEAALDRQRFILAVPVGTVNSAGERFWNATDFCCDAQHTHVDDVGFLRAVVADVEAQLPVDRGRVVVVGHSNGGFMALRLACEASDVVTAVVSVAGSTWSDAARCPPGRPLSVLLIHGTADELIAYGGQPGVPGHPGAVETAQRFAARAGCTGPLVETERMDLVGDGAAETRRQVAQGCPADAQVELWTMEGVGHKPGFKAGWAPKVLEWVDAHRR
jgi:polyhydroxybutyrate depolymerase